METKKKFESIDLTMLDASQRDGLLKLKTISKNFKTEDKDLMSKIDGALDKIIDKIKQTNPDAIKSTAKSKVIKKTKTASSKTAYVAKAPKATNTTQRGKRTVMTIASEIRKPDEKWGDAVKRAKEILQNEKQQVNAVIKTQTDKLLEFIKKTKELDGLSGTTVNKDIQIQALPKGKRVSKKGWKNQYGESKGGRVYYENRDNRSDRLAPNFKDKVFLESGGEIDSKKVGNAKRLKVRNWYVSKYPDDELGEEINPNVSFWDVWVYVSQGYDIYATLGVSDSIVRERTFEKLAEILDVNYEVIYQKWYSRDSYANGGEMFADGGSIGRYEVVKVIGFDEKGKTLPQNKIKVIADFPTKKEAVNFVYEQQFKRDITQRDIFIRDTKNKKDFADGGKISSTTTYIPNRDVKELHVVLKGELLKLSGSDVVDGVYAKNDALKNSKTKGTKTTTSKVKSVASAISILIKINTIAKKEDGDVGFGTDEIQQLLDAGFTEKDILVIYQGYTPSFVNADTEFGKTTSGLVKFSAESHKKSINKILDNAKDDMFEIGMKYPNFDWKAIAKKFDIDIKPKYKIVKVGSREYEYEYYTGKGIIIGHSTNYKLPSDKRWEKSDSKIGVVDFKTLSEFQERNEFQAGFNGGYWGIVVRNIEDIYYILDTLLKQKNGYAKDIEVFTNGLGGIGAKEAKGESFESGGALRVENSKYGYKQLLGYEPYFDKHVTVASIFEDEKVVRPSHGYFYPNPMAKKVIRWAKKNGYDFVQDGKKYASGGSLIGIAETPLAHAPLPDYTGLVGETGAMASGEMFANGGEIGKNYEIELFWTGLPRPERIIGKYVVTEKTLDRLEEEFAHIISIDVIDETNQTPTKSYYELKKELYAIGKEKYLFKSGGLISRVKDADIQVGKSFTLQNDDVVTIKRLFTENQDEDWVEWERNGKTHENSVKDVRMFINRVNGHSYASGGSITDVADAIFFPNQKSGKISTGFGSKTKEGLFAMITNVNYDAKEVSDAIFEFNEKSDRINTGFGSKTKEGLTEMIRNARNNYANGGKISSTTTYIPNRDVKEVHVIFKGELIKLSGSDVVDGVYAKNDALKSAKNTVTKKTTNNPNIGRNLHDLLRERKNLYSKLNEAEINWSKDNGVEYNKILKEIELNREKFYSKLNEAEFNFIKDNGKEYNELMAIKGYFANGGELSSTRTTYIPNRDVKEIHVVLKGELVKLSGSDVVDGVYAKNDALKSAKNTVTKNTSVSRSKSVSRGKSKTNTASKREIYIKELSSQTRTMPDAVTQFVDEEKLDEDSILSLSMGIGRGHIKPMDFVEAILGNEESKAKVVDYAKNKRGFQKTVDGYARGGRLKSALMRDRKYVNNSESWERAYSKDKPKRRGYKFEDGGDMPTCDTNDKHRND